MSKLETEVKPLIEPMLSGRDFTLETAAQAVFSVWATKNVMVFESLRTDPPWFFSDRERRLLRETLRPPVRTNIWIAKCTGHTGVYSCALDLAGTIDGAKERFQAHVTTIAFGSLAIQVVAGKFPTAVPLNQTVDAEIAPGNWNSVAVRIWPRLQEAICWPPSSVLQGASGLEAFSERWSPTAN